jgi:SET domain-containing protein
MMLVRTRVAPSLIHGLGLFAMDVIPLGTPIWKFEPGFDREFSAEQFVALPSEAQAHVRWFAFLDKTTAGWVLSGDHACFMNHSPDPNTGAPPGGTPPIITVARRDIAAGEELTCNYWDFDAEAGKKLGTASGSD